MAKTNFTKVEEALAEGLQKISISQYLAAAPSKKEQAASSEKERHSERRKLLLILQTELNYLQKQGEPVYEKFQIKKSWVPQLIEKVEKISPEEWNQVIKVKTELTEWKKQKETAKPEEINERLVQEQTKKHRTKRFNVNEKWLPLK